MHHPVLANARRERRNITGVIGVLLDEAQLWRVAGSFYPVCHVIHHASGGAGGILRVKRKNEHALNAFLLELIQRVANRRVAITHRPGDFDIHMTTLTKQPLEQLGLPLGVYA